MEGQFIINKTTGNIGIFQAPEGNPLTIKSFKDNWNLGINVKTKRQYHSAYHLEYTAGGFPNGFYVNSEFLMAKSVWTPSDSSVKKDIFSIQNPINLINQLKGYTFKWKSNDTASSIDSSYVQDTKTHFGFIAQKVDSSFPSYSFTKLLPDGHYLMNYNEVTPLLVEGVKKLNSDISTLNTQYTTINNYYQSTDSFLEHYTFPDTCNFKQFLLPNRCSQFLKTDYLNASSRYIEAINDPSSDKRRFWIDLADNKSLKYWDNQTTPVKQTVELKSNKDVANGYVGLNGSSKINGALQTYGTASNTACQGNDTRLSNPRNQKLDYASNTTTNIPSVTTESIFATITIPGGTLNPTDVIEVNVDAEANLNANSKIVRMYLSSTTGISGTLVANQDMSNNSSFSGNCRIAMKNSASIQEISGIYRSWATSKLSTATKISTTVNSTSNMYLIITGQKANPGDNIELIHYEVTIKKQ